MLRKMAVSLIHFKAGYFTAIILSLKVNENKAVFHHELQNCKVHNDTIMLCKTPNTQAKVSRTKRAALGEASFGFAIADVSDLLRWSEDNNVTLETYEDPVYEMFDPNPKMKEGVNLLIMVSIILFVHS